MPDNFIVGQGSARFQGSAILALQQTVTNDLFTIDGEELEYVLQGVGQITFSGTATVIG